MQHAVVRTTSAPSLLSAVRAGIPSASSSRVRHAMIESPPSRRDWLQPHASQAVQMRLQRPAPHAAHAEHPAHTCAIFQAPGRGTDLRGVYDVAGPSFDDELSSARCTATAGSRSWLTHGTRRPSAPQNASEAASVSLLLSDPRQTHGAGAASRKLRFTAQEAAAVERGRACVERSRGWAFSQHFELPTTRFGERPSTAPLEELRHRILSTGTLGSQTPRSTAAEAGRRDESAALGARSDGSSWLHVPCPNNIIASRTAASDGARDASSDSECSTTRDVGRQRHQHRGMPPLMEYEAHARKRRRGLNEMFNESDGSALHVMLDRGSVQSTASVVSD
ncbi:hypothetical protein EON66_06655 [archaeon]|nr:MAG: hypothetical protein EON66_06655 [archaeon]